VVGENTLEEKVHKRKIIKTWGEERRITWGTTENVFV